MMRAKDICHGNGRVRQSRSRQIDIRSQIRHETKLQTEKKGVHSEEDWQDRACKGDHRTGEERDAGIPIDGVCSQGHAWQGCTRFTGDPFREGVMLPSMWLFKDAT
jgi:hypothetical protein